MHIGVDLDNTIICYDGLFHTLARERGWVQPDCAVHKETVRDAVRLLPEGDEKWQELQAEAYGPRLNEAAFFPDVVTAFRIWREQGHDVSIISHKTRYSGKGGHDLHSAARAFLEESSLIREGLLPGERIFFCASREEKISRIAASACDVFIDDLIEVFSEPAFPETVRKIHFAPDSRTVSPPDALIGRSWREVAAYDPLVDRAAAQAAAALPQKLERLSGGRNSRVWKCGIPGSAPIVVKRYPRDGRDRLGAESAAFTLLHSHGLHCVPEVLAVFPEQAMAAYSWLEGEPLIALGGAPEAVEPFAALIEGLWHVGKSAQAPDAPLAAEACVSLTILAEQISSRLTRLLKIPAETDATRAMQHFLRNEAVPEWERCMAEAEKGYAVIGRSPEHPLADEERILSPSDFGCHNAVKTSGGNVGFVDFEYFGWDDPVKLVSDFVLHPGMHLTDGQKEYFQRRVMNLCAGTGAPARFTLLLPLFAVKWTCILLNEFLPAALTTRRFASEAAPPEAVLENQLAKARAMLHNTTNRRF